MLLTLIKALATTDITEVVQNLSLATIDIDLLLYEAQDKKEIEINKKKNKVKLLKETGSLYYSLPLAKRLVDMIKRYDSLEANVTLNRLREIVLGGRYGYPVHDFVCTLYALENNAIHGVSPLHKYTISVPEIKKKRPANTFVFYTFLDHEEFGRKAVNKFLDTWQKTNIK
jgi:hypothetical protein